MGAILALLCVAGMALNFVLIFCLGIDPWHSPGGLIWGTAWLWTLLLVPIIFYLKTSYGRFTLLLDVVLIVVGLLLPRL